MRLDQLYRESQNLNKQIQFLEEKCINERELEKIGIHQELRNKKMFDLEQKSKYCCNLFYNYSFFFRDIVQTMHRKFEKEF